MNKLSTMLFQVVTVEQCCNNMLTILFIVGRTTLFTPVDINLEQVVDFLNFYACNYLCDSCDITFLTVFILTHPDRLIISARNTDIYKICKLRKAIFSVFYNIS